MFLVGFWWKLLFVYCFFGVVFCKMDVFIRKGKMWGQERNLKYNSNEFVSFIDCEISLSDHHGLFRVVEGVVLFFGGEFLKVKRVYSE